jgi:hypothetical protein
MGEALRILRYNTGTDKKAFVQFKQDFDAVIFNATIVAYSGSSVADLVAMHKRKYIIDPQTHIFQQDISAITVKNKKDNKIKKSVEKYLDHLPEALSNITKKERRPLFSEEIGTQLDNLVNSVYEFQTKYVKSYIKDKDYDKYLKFVKLEPEPRLIIAPYFMLKDSYKNLELKNWLAINKKCIQKAIQKNQANKSQISIAAQLVLDKEVLVSDNFCKEIKTAYNEDNYEHIFIWIDDFNSFDTKSEYMKAFADLIATLNAIGKKPIMAYGGYESIILCNEKSPYRLYGVAQSVGYGEYRNITPVGGGMPTNKYYFYPLHQRMKFNAAADILTAHGYFNKEKSPLEYATDYYKAICDCRQCHKVIGHKIDKFDKYNDSTSFDVHTRNGVISRNRPTAEAELIAAFHFLYCKVNEWKNADEEDFKTLVTKLKNNYKLYQSNQLRQIAEWCEIYGHKEN